MFDALMKLFVKDYDHPERPEVREKSGSAAGVVGIATNLLLFVIKLTAGLVSHSLAILADAINNLTDSASSIIVAVAFRLAGKPADEEHPFGHARLEYLSGVAVSFLVLFLGLELAMSSVEKIFHPEETFFGPLALCILILSILIKLWQCFFYRSVGRKIRSDAVYATSSDSCNDVIATSVVLLGALITRFTRLNLDGWLGLAVAAFIIVSGVKLVMETAQPLLGTAPDPETVRRIYEKILSYEGIIGLHDLAVHSYGAGQCFATVHCEVPAEEDVLKSHDIIDNIERDFLEQERIHLVIHLDPIVTEDPRTNTLREQVRQRVHEKYPEVSFHDFRVVWGLTHSNVVFDVAAPFSLKDSDGEIIENLTREIQKIDSTFRTVITVDREGVVNELES